MLSQLTVSLHVYIFFYSASSRICSFGEFTKLNCKQLKAIIVSNCMNKSDEANSVRERIGETADKLAGRLPSIRVLQWRHQLDGQNGKHHSKRQREDFLPERQSFMEGVHLPRECYESIGSKEHDQALMKCFILLRYGDVFG